MKRKIFSVLLMTLLLSLSIVHVAGAAEDEMEYFQVDGGRLYFDKTTGTILGLYDCDVENFTIPAEIDGVKVKHIGDYAFWDCYFLESIIISEGVLSIGDSAFEGSFINSVIIPDSITTIGEKAFYLTNIEEVNIPKNVVSIGDNAFSICRTHAFVVDDDNPNYSDEDGVLFDKEKNRLMQYPIGKETVIYTVPDSVKTIDSMAFAFCDLTEIIMPEEMDIIGEKAFSYCSDLEKINIPQGVTVISAGLFDGCMSLNDKIFIPEGVTIIDEYAFYGCQNLSEVKIPDSVITIGDNAFGFCENLAEITISEGVTKIGDHVFSDCYKLNNIFVVAENKSYCSENGVLFNKDKTILLRYPSGKTDESYTIPATVSVIAKSAFTNNTFLNNIILSNGITEIDEYTFAWDGNLTSITIPVSVISIGKGAFFRDDNLSDIYYLGSQEQWSKIDINFSSEAYSYDNEAIKNATIHYNTIVDPDIVWVFGIEFDRINLALFVESEWTIKATVNPDNASDKNINWMSDDENVAIVDNNGKVTAISVGVATITAEAVDGSGKKATCAITVNALPEGVNVNDIYNLTFDTDGGTLINSPELVQVVKDAEYKMPSATKSGYTLKFWQDKADNSKTYSANNVYSFVTDTELKAIWQYSGGGTSGSRPSNTTGATTNTEKPSTSVTTSPDTSSDNNTIVAANINNIFADVKNGEWYSEAIAYVAEKGMMNGYEDGRFGPNDNTTRGQIVTILYRLEDEPVVAANSNFVDVATAQYYAKAVVWAASNGIVNGYSETEFAPDDNVTREQIAAILFRYAQYKGYDTSAVTSLDMFSDSVKVSDWSVDSMAWCVAEGLINGDNGALRPQGDATRAEVATMLMRFCENVAK